MRSALPQWLRIAWLCLLPFGLLFAARIAWEKTVWTWARGPQIVGFSLMHMHPFLSLIGALCCYLLMLWLIPGVIYVLKRWKDVATFDKAMVISCLLITLAILIPDAFFARSR
jgi:hypothetical protein